MLFWRGVVVGLLVGTAWAMAVQYILSVFREARQDARGYWEVDGNNKVVQLGRRWE